MSWFYYKVHSSRSGSRRTIWQGVLQTGEAAAYQQVMPSHTPSPSAFSWRQRTVQSSVFSRVGEEWVGAKPRRPQPSAGSRRRNEWCLDKGQSKEGRPNRKTKKGECAGRCLPEQENVLIRICSFLCVCWVMLRCMFAVRCKQSQTTFQFGWYIQELICKSRWKH